MIDDSEVADIENEHNFRIAFSFTVNHNLKSISIFSTMLINTKQKDNLLNFLYKNIQNFIKCRERFLVLSMSLKSHEHQILVQN